MSGVFILSGSFSKLTTMSGELEQLAYEVSLRALQRQEEVVEELRSRTGTLLAASSLSASFLGARALDQSGAAWPGIIALSFLRALRRFGGLHPVAEAPADLVAEGK